MNITGMDYNTDRPRLRMPEYGRGIHQMVGHCLSLQDRDERQRCAEAIVKAMETMNPAVRQQADYKRKLWDHLAIMSDFKLDIDWPFEVTTAEKLAERPAPLRTVSHRIPVRHYGALVFQTLERLKTMEPGAERDELTRMVANQMKRDLIMYGNFGPDNDRIISDIARFTDGTVQIDPKTFQFEFIVIDKKPEEPKKKRRRR